MSIKKNYYADPECRKKHLEYMKTKVDFSYGLVVILSDIV